MKTLLKFVVVGTSGSCVLLGATWLLTEKAHLAYIISYVIGFILSFVNNYLWNTLWTFGGRFSKVAAAKYLTVSVLTIILNTGLVYLLTDLFGLWYILSACIGILTAFTINYIASRRIVWATNTPISPD